MGKDALIGATGFVGSNLRVTRNFSALYSSSNVQESAGQHFDTVFCAAAPGSMVQANQAPERDAARIDEIISHLTRLKADRIVLVSTIATLENFGRDQDEVTCSFEKIQPYGRNRRRLEEFCAAQFSNSLVLRLPALFGINLRKNLLFDLMNPVPSMLSSQRREAIAAALPQDISHRLLRLYTHDETTAMWHLDRATLDALPDKKSIETVVEAAGFEALRFTNPASSFQFFDLSLLSSMVDIALQANLRTLHLAPEAISAQQIVTALRGRPMPDSAAPVHIEDMQTRHAAIFGQTGRFIATADDVMSRLRGFIAAGGR